MEKQNLIGKKFGRWTIIDYADNIGKNPAWLCKCECGTIRKVLSCNLLSGKSISCGCVQREKAGKINKTHGLSKTRIYRIYKGMKSRCYNHNNPAYNYYGGRGIKMCDEWLNDFMNFYNWAMSNGYNDTLSIDRINVNNGYSPNNCRWIDTLGQANNKRTNFVLNICGKTHTIAEWCKLNNINPPTLYSKLYRLMKQLNVDGEEIEIKII